MNEFEKMLRKELKMYIESADYLYTKDKDGLPDNECWKNSKDLEYFYKGIPLFKGKLNPETGKKERIHILEPDIPHGIDNPESVSIHDVSVCLVKPCVYFITKEVIE